MNNRQLALDSIHYVESLLARFKRALNGNVNAGFSNLDINDLADILGFEPDEIVELLNGGCHE